MKNPKLTVLMSVYNGEKYLREAIDSILNQTFKDYEYIIINDGSTDNTGAIIDRYARNDKRIRIINHCCQEGLAKSLNDGIKIAYGKYIARMDADDTSLPERLEKQVAFLKSHPKIGVLGTYYKEIDEKGKTMPRKQNPTSWLEIRQAIFHYNPICHPSAMIRKNLLKEVGGYDESFPTSQDYELFSRISQLGRIDNLPDVLLVRRFPRKALNSRKMRQQEVDSFKVRLRLLRRKIYPWYYGIFLIRTPIILLMPVWLREAFRRFRHRRYQLK